MRGNLWDLYQSDVKYRQLQSITVATADSLYKKEAHKAKNNIILPWQNKKADSLSHRS